ncbi:TPA: hypothetical protein EYO57_17865 [Candidatus Poribacteria bacterium]|nr:hypothetical protein [Candidatus Poribacteria bacterium]
MAREKKQKESSEGAPEWMVTFADMTTLLLTFFVMLIAMANFDKVKYDTVKASFKDSMGILSGWDEPKVPPLIPPIRQKFNNEEERMRGIGYRIKKKFVEEGKPKSVSVAIKKEGLLLTLKESDRVGFSTGGIQLTSEMRAVLDKIAEEVKSESNRIAIAGHTDSQPVKGGRFPSNWELSVARARSVQQYLIQKGVAEKQTSIAGYADTQPIKEEDLKKSPAERQKANRRVEILVARKYQLPTQ